MSLAVGLLLSQGCCGLVLCQQHAADLQKLITLRCGQLVSRLKCLHLAGCGRGLRLELLQFLGISGQRLLLLIDTFDYVRVCPFYSVGVICAARFQSFPLAVRASANLKAWRIPVAAAKTECNT